MPCCIIISLSAEMLHFIATLRNLAANLQKVEEDYLEQFNLTAMVARAPIWNGDITASGTYLSNATAQSTMQDNRCRHNLLHQLKPVKIAYVCHLTAQLNVQEQQSN